MRKFLKKMTICSIFFVSFLAFPQPDLPGGGVGGEDGGSDNPAAPIDDYIPYLLIMGLGVGIYSVRLKKGLASSK